MEAGGAVSQEAPVQTGQTNLVLINQLDPQLLCNAVTQTAWWECLWKKGNWHTFYKMSGLKLNKVSENNWLSGDDPLIPLAPLNSIAQDIKRQARKLLPDSLKCKHGKALLFLAHRFHKQCLGKHCNKSVKASSCREWPGLTTWSQHSSCPHHSPTPHDNLQVLQ